jgi:hypothetical protein
MLKRNISSDLLRLAASYPIVTLTGPRQSGKTTLIRALFPDKPYLSLEDPDVRLSANSDPRGLLDRYPEGAIFDEVQRAPDLLSYLQTRVDQSSVAGQYLLTGSAQFELLDSLSQSLAGRTALAKLLPLTLSELPVKRTLNELLYYGFYPRIYANSLNPTEALGFYVNTYIERDVRSLLSVKNLATFEHFLRMCAARTGQILNLSSLGNDCGISHNTAREWLSVLEASYILFCVQPHFSNFSKRLIKSPKLFFYDVGLVSYLLGITDPKQLIAHPLRGALFETLVVSELVKLRYNAIKNNNLFYFRNHVGDEVDLILDYPLSVRPVEIKSGATLQNDFFKGLRYYANLNTAAQRGVVVYGGEQPHSHHDGLVIPYDQLGSFDWEGST